MGGGSKSRLSSLSGLGDGTVWSWMGEGVGGRCDDESVWGDGVG